MSTTLALSMLKTLGALAIVLACFFLLARLLQRVQQGPRGHDGQMEMLGTMPVGQRERVMMIKARGKVVMIGVSPGRIHPLHVFDASNDDSGFESKLNRADQP